jgi:hypothetical protein
MILPAAPAPGGVFLVNAAWQRLLYPCSRYPGQAASPSQPDLQKLFGWRKMIGFVLELA